MHYFCTRIKALAYGVMVAHQILVLPVKVRVPVRQQPSDFSEGFFIFVPMQHFSKILILFLFVLAAACAKMPDSIVQYEQTRHQIKIVKMLNVSNLEPFTAADSLAICQAELRKRKTELIGIQQHFIDSISVAIANAQRRADGESDAAMKKALAMGIRSMENKKATAQQIIAAYNNSPETTSLNAIICQADKYRQMGDSTIVFVQQCTFIGRQGSLPEETFSRKYLLSSDNQTIIGEITEP